MKKTAISLGAGVQSSTVYLMAVDGVFNEVPECAFFADTKFEPKWVYEHLEYLKDIGNHIIPIETVGIGSLKLHTIKSITEGRRFASLPAHVRNPQGKGAMLRRQCTREFKIQPLEAALRGLLGVSKGERVPKGDAVEVWIGISTDEASRMRDANHKWQLNRYPLIEKRMSRADCIRWLESHGYRVPKKSACVACPYHDNKYWRDLKDNAPEAWAEAVEFDAMIRTGLRGVDCEAFLHRSLVPLPEVDLSTAEDRGQINMFNNECEGMCGV
jgi:hypothetical protein